VVKILTLPFTADPSWKLIARSSGLRKMVAFKAGLNTPKDGDFIEPCSKYFFLFFSQPHASDDPAFCLL
jgi:hypothetical protein